jgi:hypothetical protein
VTANPGEIKALSKALFGNRHQLEIACAVANDDSGVFTATTLSTRTGVPHNLVGPILTKFERAGAITLAPVVPGTSSKFYLRKDSNFWTACLSVLGSLTSDFEASITSGAVR